MSEQVTNCPVCTAFSKITKGYFKNLSSTFFVDYNMFFGSIYGVRIDCHRCGVIYLTYKEYRLIISNPEKMLMLAKFLKENPNYHGVITLPEC